MVFHAAGQASYVGRNEGIMHDCPSADRFSVAPYIIQGFAVAFDGNAAGGEARRWLLTAEKITANNEFESAQAQVRVIERTINDFQSGARLSLPPFSMLAVSRSRAIAFETTRPGSSGPTSSSAAARRRAAAGRRQGRSRRPVALFIFGFAWFMLEAKSFSCRSGCKSSQPS